MMRNEMKLTMDALSENEGVARICVATFLAKLHPTLEEMDDVKTAVSEAITNAIIHGCPADQKVFMTCSYNNNLFRVEIADHGVGIEDVEKALQPMYTTKSKEERSGMGFSFMEAFMDSLKVWSKPGQGTVVIMEKQIGSIRLGEAEA